MKKYVLCGLLMFFFIFTIFAVRTGEYEWKQYCYTEDSVLYLTALAGSYIDRALLFLNYDRDALIESLNLGYHEITLFRGMIKEGLESESQLDQTFWFSESLNKIRANVSGEIDEDSCKFDAQKKCYFGGNGVVEFEIYFSNDKQFMILCVSDKVVSILEQTKLDWSKYSTNQQCIKYGHIRDDGKVTKEPSCLDSGIKTFYCKSCKIEMGTESFGSATGHLYDDGKITKEATCTENGIKTYTCHGCGQTKTEEISAIGHDIRYFKNNKTGDKFFMCANCKEQMCIGAKGPAGGFIFYDCDADNDSGNKDGLKSYECGWRYLEAAPADLPKEYMWGDSGSFGTKTGIGEGKNNTKIIVEKASKERTENAATACNSYSVNGYSDWFLPSIDELDLMCNNLKGKGISIEDWGYWSSSESSSAGYYVWGLHYSSFGPFRESSFVDRYVRPCRAF